MSYIKYFSIIVFLFYTGCIEQIELTIGENPILVIDGNLTDQAGIHYVTLDYSSGFNKNAIFEKTRKEVIGATVQIIDNLGNIETLSEEQNGKYATSGTFKGEITRS